MSEVFLVATDATEAGTAALRMAVQLARLTGATVLAVHVVETPKELVRWSAPIFKSELHAYHRLLAQQMGVAERALCQQIQTIPDKDGVEVKVVVKSGSVVETVLELARSLEGALIILGKGRQPSSLAAMADRIARLARRPVLLVPNKWSRRLRSKVAMPRIARRRGARALRAAS